MQRWRGLDAIPADWGRCVVTIGVFDGVHRGHARLITKAVSEAERLGVKSVLMTFDPHPSEVVRPGSHPAQLTTMTRRAELVEGLGMDAILVMPFTAELSRLSPEGFVHEVLVERLHAAEVVVGENFTFGRKAAGNVEMLKALGQRFGFGVHGITLFADHEVTVSSTYVRSCVDAGDVAAAAEALGRPHRIEGVVVRGDGRGKELGYPTANIESPLYTAVPADGVYAGWFTVLGTGPLVGTVSAGARRMAAVSVGSNPTFEGRSRTVEAYVLDEDTDLYGQHVALDFVQRLRGMERFGSIDDLLVAMARDVRHTRELLSSV